MERVFFCFGPPKSGTTFLQRLLDSHPAICCPPEQNLLALYGEMKRVSANYNAGLRTAAKRTGGQKPLELSDPVIEDWLCAFAKILAKNSRHEKANFGISDNSVLTQLPLFGRLFPKSKFLAVFRHPLPRALSAWQHNRTLAELENSDEHLRPLQAAGNFDNWCLAIAKDFVDSVRRFREACSSGAIQGQFVLYESLRRQDVKALGRALAFLDAARDDRLVRSLYQQNDFDQQRQSAPHPHFFRAGTVSIDDVPVDPRVRDQVLDMCQPELQFLGYEQHIRMV